MNLMPALQRALIAAAVCILASCETTVAAQGQIPASEAPSAATTTEYPTAMRGEWMPEEMGCSEPLNYDGESLLFIGADMLGQYENTTKPLAVKQISRRPPTWKILSTFSPGTGEYEGKEPISKYPPAEPGALG